jgi:hypothetical protein
MVLVLGMVALGWWAWRWSQKTILLVQAAIAVAQAVVIVLFVMRERKWQQQENLQKSSTPELKGSVSTNSADVFRPTESEIYSPRFSPSLFSMQPILHASVLQPEQNGLPFSWHLRPVSSESPRLLLDTPDRAWNGQPASFANRLSKNLSANHSYRLTPNKKRNVDNLEQCYS